MTSSQHLFPTLENASAYHETLMLAVRSIQYAASVCEQETIEEKHTYLKEVDFDLNRESHNYLKRNASKSRPGILKVYNVEIYEKNTVAAEETLHALLQTEWSNSVQILKLGGTWSPTRLVQLFKILKKTQPLLTHVYVVGLVNWSAKHMQALQMNSQACRPRALLALYCHGMPLRDSRQRGADSLWTIDDLHEFLTQWWSMQRGQPLRQFGLYACYGLPQADLERLCRDAALYVGLQRAMLNNVPYDLEPLIDKLGLKLEARFHQRSDPFANGGEYSCAELEYALTSQVDTIPRGKTPHRKSRRPRVKRSSVRTTQPIPDTKVTRTPTLFEPTFASQTTGPSSRVAERIHEAVLDDAQMGALNGEEESPADNESAMDEQINQLLFEATQVKAHDEQALTM